MSGTVKDEPALLSVRGLITEFATPGGLVRAVDDISFDIRRGEVVCLVGESGSGKSVTGLSLMRLIEPPGKVQGHVAFQGRDLFSLPEADMNHVRGAQIAMIFQEPMTALNPARRVGDQIAEVLRIHTGLSQKDAAERAVALLERVGIRNPAARARAYPHQLSGGMRQRVMIAIACALQPALIIADEPTTALDVTVQAQVLDLLFEMQAELGSALLFVTHDLGVVAEIADRVVVLYHGKVVEQGDVAQIFSAPEHPYTQALLAAAPDVDAPRVAGRRFATLAEPVRSEKASAGPRVAAAVAAPHPAAAGVGQSEALLEIRDLRRDFVTRRSWTGRPLDTVHAVGGVSLTVPAGQTLAIIGESGSGKSTLGRCVARLDQPTSGRITYAGRDIGDFAGEDLLRFRREVQTIFQDPYASLNPRRSIGEAIGDGPAIHGLMSPEVRHALAAELLERVGLKAEHAERYPHQFSGGQRQRIAIARALALSPHFIIADEAVSALDVSVRAQVLNLLADLQEERGLTYLFISHDMGTVRQFADRVAIMQGGRLVEEGETERIFEAPREDYTKDLLRAVPRMTPYSPRRRRPLGASL
ncbi:Glutathione import ATP-binding protein GsiA [Bosea sp. 62]|uniref:ABC transporter ATP-binding protein n=1 Tax=unclassified Bosea (in: a-proteobacteria) TaxID=2653178 RepID=UPI0012553C18|nr:MULTISPECIES: ABC transporter ATP-binding protein [unclassified Bosea (in: a-proteobacteria)]CAD5292822.1 Glutathione import ATP-binding protein GsiA [Bosea sp. 21B]CAD5293431.1 Glutathione import ATP-binding protein GsiA [Bosea sp. 46]CAD5299648.1 Glutathione import ATP-binding protein GsiA [Bosea sp. 7B]VVT62235.1 Glutathione import ATP-binding protein GsiA [Bosea sp. EC-HK365B]VXB08386.1 Glutathione import ATP-binding protein GsiA [Bosea sp. 125]